ncbi:MAG TPA: M28 family peptidase [Polyangiaceae bacterium]|nr:M28 family peptidase [Polyangiaceae bacterium]
MKARFWRRLWFYGGLAALACAACYFATAMPGTSYRGELPPPTREVEALQLRLRRHVSTLAATVGERRLAEGDSLARARDYIATVLGGIETLTNARLEFEKLTGTSAGASNVVFELAGATEELVVVGAHYDTALGTPGANDNASGVAAGLELARLLATRRHHRTLRFVFFANEEQPYFQQAGMGSLAHAEASRARGDRVKAMLALESLGHYSTKPGSQRYPPLVGRFYPDQGNFVGFVGNLRSRSLVRDAIGTFRASSAFPSEGAALPAFVPGVGWSDHWSFWQVGYPAIMVTDTAIFRDPHYHEASDVAARLDYLGLARVTRGLEHVIDALAKAD